jgi:predicted alpha/beta hydrolase
MAILASETSLPNRLDIRVFATDGFPICGTIWQAGHANRSACVAVLNSGAGIPSVFYDRFALWLARSGITTATYDYRGIGRSRPRRLRNFSSSIEDWGSKDCAAILHTVEGLYPKARIAVIGHSIGGFVTGFVGNAGRVERIAMIGGHTGYWGDYSATFRIPMFASWHVAMPLLASTLGFFPGRAFGLPEDLPLGIAMEWAKRLRPEFWWYLKNKDGQPDHERIEELRRRFAALRAKLLTVYFSDDPFVTSAATGRIEGLFCNCIAERCPIDPILADVRKIGHFGFFRKGCSEKFWPILRNWLDPSGGPP